MTDRILIAAAVLAVVMLAGLGVHNARPGLTCMDEHNPGAGLCHRLIRVQ